MRGKRRKTWVICISAWLVLVTGAGAGDEKSPRAERLRFDHERQAWLHLPKPEPGTAAGDLALARAAFSNGQYKQARKAILAWDKNYGDTSEHYPEALLLRAGIEKARRNYHVAHQLLEQFLSEFGATDLADDALIDLFNIAEVQLSGVRRKLWGMRLLNATEPALDILDRISTDYPETSLAELALKTKGDYFFQRGDFALAELEYGRLMQEFPASRYQRYAMRRSADAALASFAGVRFDDAPLVEAEERYRLYAQQYAGLAEQEGIGLILQDILEKRATKELEIGYYYRRTQHPRAASFYFASTMKNWPDTIAATKAAEALSYTPEEQETVDVDAPNSTDAGVQTGRVKPMAENNGSERP